MTRQKLPETEGSRQPAPGSGSSSDETQNLSDAEGPPCTPSQVEAIFFAALNEKTAAARADYLARACGDNATLRLRVERLLIAHPEAVDFLAQPAVERRQVERLDSVEDNGGLPATIGRYRVIRLLGQGGFGRVYLAHDDDLDRPVAIKVPNPERVAGPEDVEAYLAEARILAQLDHPHIVPVYDVGRTDDGLCYVVSKFIEGSDLAERMRSGPAVLPGVGRAGGDGRRGAAPRPHAGPGPPRHQARQHPARRGGQAVSWPTSGWR